MNATDAQRLLEEQTTAIRLTDERIEQLKKFKSDYEALHKRLEMLPDKLTHDVMVPFGELAFMPGQLVHTNEVLVLLGDNWFVDRSACQACSIIDRRVEVLDEQLEELAKQRGLLEPRKEFTQELWDVGQESEGRFEIREEYDEQTERLWKEKHRESMKRYRQQQRAEAEKVVATPQPAPLTDAELWARLDELEDAERVGREIEKLDEEGETEQDLSQTTPSTNSSGLSNRVEQAPPATDPEGDTESEEDEDSDDYEDEDEDDDWGAEGTVLPRPTSIRFSHTPTEVTQTSGSTPPESVEAGLPVITSPADVYKHFAPQGPRSILRSPGESSQGTSRNVTITEPPQTELKRHSTSPKPQPVSVDAKAFTGSIVEHTQPDQVEAPRIEDADAPRMSRFKAQRLRQQNR